MKGLAVLGLFLLLTAAGQAQELTRRQKAGMLSCALHGKEAWVDSNRYPSFSYVVDPVRKGAARNLYIAFWGKERADGKLLVVRVTKSAKHKDAFTLVNEGWIFDNKGHLEVRDLLGGVSTYEQGKAALGRLSKRAKAVTASPGASTETSCATDFPNYYLS